MSTSNSKLEQAESNAAAADAAASETLEDQHQSGSPIQSQEKSDQSETIPETGGEEDPDGEEEEEEEEGECGFCLFMKGGGCKDSFTEWEKCIEEAEKNKEDIVEKCFEITGALKKCMEAHAEYYDPILKAEKLAEAEEEAIIEVEKEPTPDATQQNTNSENSEELKAASAGGK